MVPTWTCSRFERPFYVYLCLRTVFAHSACQCVLV